jgi:hypothetical protein
MSRERKSPSRANASNGSKQLEDIIVVPGGFKSVF